MKKRRRRKKKKEKRVRERERERERMEGTHGAHYAEEADFNTFRLTQP